MAEITWIVEWLECKPKDDDNRVNVVSTVGWRCNGVDGEYSATVYGTASLPAPSDTFTAYDQLTQEQILDWVWANGVDKEAFEAQVSNQIESQKNPPLVKPTLPWV